MPQIPSLGKLVLEVEHHSDELMLIYTKIVIMLHEFWCLTIWVTGDPDSDPPLPILNQLGRGPHKF